MYIMRFISEFPLFAVPDHKRHSQKQHRQVNSVNRTRRTASTLFFLIHCKYHRLK